MKSPFLHMIDPASVRAAAERLQTTAPATRQGGRRARDIIAPELDPEIDDILSEIEARQSDEGDFDTFLDRIGVGSAEVSQLGDAAHPSDADSPGCTPGSTGNDPLLQAALEEEDESSAETGSADGDIQDDDAVEELDDLEDVQNLVDGRELEEGDPTE